MESYNFAAALYLFLILLSFSVSVGGIIFTFYRRGVTGARSFTYLSSQAGILFDPEVVRAFIQLRKEDQRIQVVL